MVAEKFNMAHLGYRGECITRGQRRGTVPRNETWHCGDRHTVTLITLRTLHDPLHGRSLRHGRGLGVDVDRETLQLNINVRLFQNFRSCDRWEVFAHVTSKSEVQVG